MPEEWEMTSGDSRTENQLTTFIVFCEDQNDEPIYFRSFEVENKVKINCIPNQKKSKLNLINTLAYCNDAGLVECVDHRYRIWEGTTENIWCVYDRDLENEDLEQIRAVDDLEFTTAIQTAEDAGLRIAWSNDAFELWILLHFEEVAATAKLHRVAIYARLTKILVAVSAIKAEYFESINNGTFGYKKNLKKKYAFLTHVLPILKTKLQEAIVNATRLEENFMHAIPYQDCNPCTRVHHLINDILAAQNQ